MDNCKFYKKVFLGTKCELFKIPCYGKYCNFNKEFTLSNKLCLLFNNVDSSFINNKIFAFKISLPNNCNIQPNDIFKIKEIFKNENENYILFEKIITK